MNLRKARFHSMRKILFLNVFSLGGRGFSPGVDDVLSIGL